MADPITISKNNPHYPEYLNFARLRDEGISHIEALSGKVWTDYNLHDPGITVLELLCYALTDLGFRTNFEIKDILTADPQTGREEDNFFTAAEILSCNPLTLLDYRKLLIDIEGVKNAWLLPADKAEMEIYVNAQQSKLQFEPLTPTNPQADPKLTLKGLYNVYLELENIRPSDLTKDACGNEYLPVSRILTQAKRALHQHRNLGEDFLNIRILQDEQIGVCADLELDAHADPNEVLVEVYNNIQTFLSPSLTFYTLQEMLDKGKSMDEIFEGRPLLPHSHGFIDTDELADLEWKNEIHASDVYRVIMAVPGVRAIKKLSLSSFIEGNPQLAGQQWTLPLTELYRPVFSPKYSRFNFFKGMLPFRANEKEVLEAYQDRLSPYDKVKREGEELDHAVPQGTYQELEDYLSIQHDLPLTYGVGLEGLPDSANDLRKAQVHQLKGYLMFFDQMLANYLAQLSHIRDLFYVRRDTDRPADENRSYFAQELTNVPYLQELLIREREATPGGSKHGPQSPIPLEYQAYLNHISEDEATYHDRRNRFLDHLLARFSEDFTDYVLLMYALNGKRNDEEEIIADKSAFLKNYPEISRNRGKGFDQRQLPLWNSPNVSGIERRVGRMMGVNNIQRRHLSNCEVIYQAGSFQFQLKTRSGRVLLQSKRSYAEGVAAKADWENCLSQAMKEECFRRIDCSAELLYGFELMGLPDPLGSQEVLAVHEHWYGSPALRDQAIRKLINYVLNDGVSHEIVHTVGSYFFQLFDETDRSQLLLQSDLGYTNPEAAWEGYEAFLALSQETTNYHVSKNPHESNWQLQIGRTATAILASSATPYESEASAREAIAPLVSYFQSRKLHYSIQALPVTFRFQLEDGLNNLLWESYFRYGAREQAVLAFEEMVLLSRQKENYVREDNAETCVFGFALKNARQQIIATHPAQYESPEDREKALQRLISYANLPRLKPDILEVAGPFFFRLYDEQDQTLLRSEAAFADYAAARRAFFECLGFASQWDHYQTLFSEDGCGRGFAVIDEDSLVLATHPEYYGDDADKDEAIANLIDYLYRTDFPHTLIRTADTYHYVLLDEAEERALLIGKGMHPSEEAAYLDFRNCVNQAQEYPHFALSADTPYTFSLLADAQQIAWHPQEYETESAREAAIYEIIAYVTPREMLFELIELDPPFHLLLADPKTKGILLKRRQDFESKEVAEEAIPAFRAVAAEPQNYYLFSDETYAAYGFELMDPETSCPTVLALHPNVYETAAERDAALEQTLALAQESEITANHDPGPWVFRVTFRARDRAGNLQTITFQGTQPFEQEAEATSAFVFFQHLVQSSAHLSRNDEQQIQVLDESQSLVATSQETATEEQLAYWQDYLAANSPYSQSQSGYTYHMTHAEGTATVEQFRGTPIFVNEDEAWRACDHFLAKVQDSANFSLQTRYESGCTVAVNLVDDHFFQAEHEDRYTSLLAREQTIETIHTYLKTGPLPYSFTEVSSTEAFSLTDRQHHLLFSVENEIGNPDKLDNYFDLIHLASSRSEWEASRTEPLSIRLEKEAQQYPVVRTEEGYHFQILNWECDQLVSWLRSKNTFDSAELAQDAYTVLVDQLADVSRYRRDKQSHSFALFPNESSKEELAYCPLIFSSEAERDAQMEALSLRKLETVIVALEPGFVIRLVEQGSEAQTVLLEGSKRFTDETEAETYSLYLQKIAQGKANYRPCEFFQLSFLDQVELTHEALQARLADPSSPLLDQTQKALLIQLGTDLLAANKGINILAGTSRQVTLQDAAGTALFEGVENLSLTDAQFRHEVLFAAQQDANFQKVYDPPRGFGLILRNTQNQILAQHPVFYPQEADLDHFIAAFRHQAGSYPITGQAGEYYYKIIHAESLVWLLESKQSYTSLDAVTKAYENALHLGKNKQNYYRINKVDMGEYCFDLVDRTAILAKNEERFRSQQAASDFIAEIVDSANNEGFHVLEHILLRPREKDQGNAWYFRIVDPQGKILFSNATAFPDQETAKAAGDFFVGKEIKYTDIFLAYNAYLHEYSLQLSRDFILIREGSQVGPAYALRSTQGFPTQHLAEQQKRKLLCALHSLGSSAESVPTVQIYNDPEKLADHLLPISVEAAKLESDACTTCADPYSFWATVILPAWPQRFSNMNFRDFFENTLRLETPAHMALKICWVSARQMRQFENAYKKWLQDNASEEGVCSRPTSLHNLISIMTRLKNVYPAATLHDCKDDGDQNPVILNYTILGTA